MAVNATVSDNSLSLPTPAHYPLVGDFVVKFPFVALKRDAEGGLDLTWDKDYRRGTQPCNVKGVKVDLGAFPVFCWNCNDLHSTYGMDEESRTCPGCNMVYPVSTFVSADPSDPKKRVYWPIGSLPRTVHDRAQAGEEADHIHPYILALEQMGTPRGRALQALLAGAAQAKPVEAETSSSPLCIITPSLGLRRETSYLQFVQTLKDNGIINLEDVQVIVVQVGPEKVCRRTLSHLPHLSHKLWVVQAALPLFLACFLHAACTTRS